MCQKRHPDCLKDEVHDPSECTPEQIRECHGDVKEHPCENTSEDK